MTAYIDTLLDQRGRRPDTELAWELRSALAGNPAGNKDANAAQMLVLQVCTVAHCDSIESILKSKRKSIQAAADFARARGLSETAKILANVLKDEPVPGPVGMSANILGKDVPIPLPPELNDKWAATDLTLSLIDESLDTALLDFVAEHHAEFAPVKAPPAVVNKNALLARITALASKKSALDIVRDLLAHRTARIRACVSEPDRTGKASDWLEVAVEHRAQKPLAAKKVEPLRARHGNAADALLDIYAAANGMEFFVANNEPGFILLPVEHWQDSIEHVMLWARDIDFMDEPDAIPAYLEDAIPFGHIPGDARYWLLITKGAHAGKVMLSGDDVLDDQPRHESIDEFFAALMLNIPGVLGSGGYISYARAGDDDAYYPEEYLF